MIHNILHTARIRSQEELLKRLEQEGVDVTQATLSRGLKFLSVARVPNANGEYIYSVDAPQDPFVKDDLQREVTSIEFSGNLAMIKTKYGHGGGSR